MSGPGHNRGPSMEEGASWRRHCWQQARRDLLPTLPLEVVRLRVKRARDIGLDYRTYANVRASTGQDIVAFLFSSNALRLFAPKADLPADRQARLATLLDCQRIAVLRGPLRVDQVQSPHLDGCIPSPVPLALWREMRASLRGALNARRLPAEAVLLIGDTAEERAWADAGALAGYLPAERFFGESRR